MQELKSLSIVPPQWQATPIVDLATQARGTPLRDALDT